MAGGVKATDSGIENADEGGGDVRVFVSYRRDDVPDATDRLAGFLVDRFGHDHVFLDVDSIDIGAPFVKVVGEWVERCDVLLAVIGRGWLDAAAEDGRRRLDDPRDYVRLEIESALAREIRVVPVLIHGARIPSAAQLPETLAPLLERNAIELSRSHWDFDVRRLISGLERIARDTSVTKASSREQASVDEGVRVAASNLQAGRGKTEREGSAMGATEDSPERLRQSAGGPNELAPSRSAPSTGNGRRGRAQRSTPWRLLGVAGVTLVAVLVAVLLIANSGGVKRAAKLAKAHITRGPIAVGGEPYALAVGEGGVWVTSHKDSTVSRIDPSTGRIVGHPIRVGKEPYAIAAGEGGVWVANLKSNTVSRIDPTTGRVVGQPIRVGKEPDAVAVGEGRVWVANYHDNTVTRIDPGSGDVIGRPIRVGQGPSAIAVALGVAWVANEYVDHSVTRIDARSGRVIGGPTRVGREPFAVAAGDGSVWVANYKDNTVTRIDPGSGEAVGRAIRVGREPNALAVGDGFVWVTSRGDNTVTRIDTRSGEVIGGPIHVGRRPNAIAIGSDGLVWVDARADNTVVRIDPRSFKVI